MNLEEAIEQTKELSARKYEKAIRCQFCYENPDRDRSFACMNCSIGYGRLADWLEELKELREYKRKYRWHDLRKNPDRKSTRLNSSHTDISRMPSSA